MKSYQSTKASNMNKLWGCCGKVLVVYWPLGLSGGVRGCVYQARKAFRPALLMFVDNGPDSGDRIHHVSADTFLDLDADRCASVKPRHTDRVFEGPPDLGHIREFYDSRQFSLCRPISWRGPCSVAHFFFVIHPLSIIVQMLRKSLEWKNSYKEKKPDCPCSVCVH